MRSLDCTDVKALLSGLIDDQVDEPTRYAAERHLADCASCRTLVDEAEALDELVAAEVASLEDPRGLPEGFAGVALGRTLFDQRSRPYLRQWTTWTGWVAAAATLALAISLWSMRDERVASPPPLVAATPPGGETGVLPTVYASSSLRSWTLPETEEPSVARLTRDDSDALYFASILLGMLSSPEADVDQVKEAVEYDRLLPKLRRIAPNVSTEERRSLLATEALLVRVVDTPLSNDDLQTIRRTADDLDLARTLELTSNRWGSQEL